MPSQSHYLGHVDNPADAAYEPPKKVTSWRVCPKCGSRATKMFSLNTGKYQCQVCDHEYEGPSK